MQNPQGKPKKLLFFFFLFLRFLDLFSPPRRRPHSISGKIHPRLIAEKSHAKPPRKTKKFAFFFLLPALSRSVLGVFIPHLISGKIHPHLIGKKIHAKPPKENQKKKKKILADRRPKG